MAGIVKETVDWALLDKAAKASPIERFGFDPESLVHRPNILLQCFDDLALFEYESNGVYSGHYFFSMGGRESIYNGRKMLDHMFSNGAEVIKGLTPKNLRAAKWMNRKLGFKYYGDIDTHAGPMELYILTKKEYTE